MIISFAALVGVAYLIVSALTYRIGFPLDDALPAIARMVM
jgi:hypothetical protein